MTTAYPPIIDGRLVTTAESFAVGNPAHGRIIGHAPHGTAALLDRAVAAARAAFPAWAAQTSDQRAATLCHSTLHPLAQSGPGTEFNVDRLKGHTSIQVLNTLH